MPFMSNTTVTQNVAEKLGTTEEGAHMAMIGLTTGLLGGVFRLALLPFAVVELVKAYKKDRVGGLVETGAWYFMGSATGITVKKGTTAAIKTISRDMKGS